MSKLTRKLLQNTKHPQTKWLFQRFFSDKPPPKKCYAGKHYEYKLVLVRHGESEFNAKNLFCGWYDSYLTPWGQKEAASAGELLRRAGYVFDIAYTSMLSRAQETLQIILMQNDRPTVRTVESWRLNERHYGALTGLNKEQTAEKYGEEQVQLWRRSYKVAPPPMEPDHPYYDDIYQDVRYDGGPAKDKFPKCESLEMTVQRTLPFWFKSIVPSMREGKKVLVVAHGNSIRGIVKHVEDLSESEIVGVNIPTATPIVYTLNTNMKPKKPREFVGDIKEIEKKISKMKGDAKKKG